MIKTANLRKLWSFVFIIFVLMIVNPYVLIAQDQAPEYQGYYSNKLDGSIDLINEKISENMKSYKKDKSAKHLNESYNLILQSIGEIDSYLTAATRRLQDTPEDAKVEKLKAQIDKLETINIRDVEMPYLCDQLFEVGQLYIKKDKKKAKKCFRKIVEKFTSYESRSCSKKAEFALKHLKQEKIR
jgi:phosphoglycerate-specific signal transduction histidine kinase